MSPQRYNIHELAAETGVIERNIRSYIDKGVLDPPIGTTRAAYYTHEHVRQLIAIRHLLFEGRSLSDIQKLIRATASKLTVEAMKHRRREVRVFVDVGEKLQLCYDPSGPWRNERRVAQIVEITRDGCRQVLEKPESDS